MLQQHGFDARLPRIHVNLHSYPLSPIVIASLVILGAGLLFALAPSKDESAVTTATADNPSISLNAEETHCDRQAWPYRDQRCIKREKAAQGSRQVRIVTDKGTSVKTATPLPIIEKKPASPPRPTIAQAAPMIGPPVVPVIENQPTDPQTAGSASPDDSKAMTAAPISPAPRGRRARIGSAPDDAISAVEEAARERGARVSVESSRGRRVYVVPRDGGEW